MGHRPVVGLPHPGIELEGRTVKGAQPLAAGLGGAVRAASGFGQVLLVIRLGVPKGLVRADLRGDGAVARLAQQHLIGRLAGLGLGEQGRFVHVDHRAVLAAAIIALAIALGGVMALPEQLQQVAEVNLRGVPHHPHHFAVARAAGADLLVGGLLEGSSRVAYRGGHHPRQAPEALLCSPETATTEHRFGLTLLNRGINDCSQHRMGGLALGSGLKQPEHRPSAEEIRA